jgi:DHA1 family inner membrane transport protein
LSPARIRCALLALALGGFGIGATEFVAMGLLPDIARDLLPALSARSAEDANAQAGWMITAYALGVVVGAPTIAAAAARWPRKQLLLWLTAAFTVGTVLSALLPTFELVVASRFVAALPHGAYFGIASLVAASLMGPGKRAQGVAFVLSGLTISNVIGVPFITFLGQNTSWRVSYLVVAAIFAFTFLAVALLVPLQPGDPGATIRNELRVFGRLQAWLALLIGAIGFGGLFAVYTYVAPLATEVAGLDVSLVPAALVVLGIGMTVGNLVGGWYADRGAARAIFLFFGILIAALVGLASTAGTPAGLFCFLFLVGGAASALSPSIQVRLMDVAKDSQSIASALNHASLNMGNAAGAFIGALAIGAGFGYLSPVWVGIGLSVAGVALTTVSFAIERRSSASVPPVRDPHPTTEPIALGG